MTTRYPEHWNDKMLADFLRDEMTRIPEDAVTAHIVTWMFRRMCEIVIGSVHTLGSTATLPLTIKPT